VPTAWPSFHSLWLTKKKDKKPVWQCLAANGRKNIEHLKQCEISGKKKKASKNISIRSFLRFQVYNDNHIKLISK